MTALESIKQQIFDGGNITIFRCKMITLFTAMHAILDIRPHAHHNGYLLWGPMKF